MSNDKLHIHNVAEDICRSFGFSLSSNQSLSVTAEKDSLHLSAEVISDNLHRKIGTYWLSSGAVIRFQETVPDEYLRESIIVTANRTVLRYRWLFDPRTRNVSLRSALPTPRIKQTELREHLYEMAEGIIPLIHLMTGPLDAPSPPSLTGLASSMKRQAPG